MQIRGFACGAPRESIKHIGAASRLAEWAGLVLWSVQSVGHLSSCRVGSGAVSASGVRLSRVFGHLLER